MPFRALIPQKKIRKVFQVLSYLQPKFSLFIHLSPFQAFSMLSSSTNSTSPGFPPGSPAFQVPRAITRAGPGWRSQLKPPTTHAAHSPGDFWWIFQQNKQGKIEGFTNEIDGFTNQTGDF
jgi:hypothetical protein